MGTRRKFIKATGLSLLSVPLIGNSIILGNLEDRKLRLGVIGCGDRGTGITSILQDHEDIDVMAFCDVLPFRLDNIGKYPGKIYKNYKSLLASPDVDAVVISTPFGMHDEMAVDAMKAGKHVYCEKTLSKGIGEIQNVLDTYRNSNVIFQTGHQYNSSDLYQKVFEIVRNGFIGEVTSFECQWNRNGNWRRPVPNSELERAINWRMYEEHSGGLTAELCSHQIDFICRLLDQAPERIAGFGGVDHWKDGRETYDNVHLIFEYPNGVDASFTCTTTNAYEHYQIKILGSKATIVMDLDKAHVYLESTKAKEYGNVDGVSGATKLVWSKGEGAPVEASSEDSTLQALEQFYRTIRKNEPILADIRSGAITAKCVQMSLDALYSKRVVNWKDYPELVF